MGRIFSPEGELQDTLILIANLAVISLLTAFALVPMVTFGAALSGAYGAAAIARDAGTRQIVATFGRGFAAGLGRATGWWLGCLALLVLGIVELIWLGDSEGPLADAMTALLLSASVIILGVTYWAIWGLVQAPRPLRELAPWAVLSFFRHLPRSLAALAIAALPSVAWAFGPEWGGRAAGICLVFGLGLIAYTHHALFDSAEGEAPAAN